MKKELFFLVFSFFLISCDNLIEMFENEKDNADDSEVLDGIYDNHQEELRFFENEDYTIKLNDDVLIISDYQYDNVKLVLNDTTIVLNSNIDDKYIPKVGDIYTCTSKQMEKFPHGISGVVECVDFVDISESESMSSRFGISDGIKVVFKRLDLNRIYSELIVKELYFDVPEQVVAANLNLLGGEIQISKGDSSLETKFVDENGNETETSNPLDVSMNLQGEITYACNGNLNLNLQEQYMEYHINTMYGVEGRLNVKGELGVLNFKNCRRCLSTIPVAVNAVATVGPIPVAITTNITLYAYGETSAGVGVETDVFFKNETSYSLTYDNGNVTCLQGNSVRNTRKDPWDNVVVSGNVNFGIGLRVLPTININTAPIIDVDQFYIDIKGYFDVQSELPLNEMTEYNAIYNTKAKFGVSYGLYSHLKVGIFDMDLNLLHNPFTRHWTQPVWTFYLAPKHTDYSHNFVNKNKSVIVTSLLSRNLLIPTTVGYNLYDKQHNLVDTKVSDNKYCNNTSNINTQYVLKLQFDNLKKGETYYIHPVVSFFGSNVDSDVAEYEFTVPLDDEEEGNVVVPSSRLGIWTVTHITETINCETDSFYVNPKIDGILQLTLNEDYTFSYYVDVPARDGEEAEMYTEVGTWSFNGKTLRLYTMDEMFEYEALLSIEKWTESELITWQEDEGDSERRVFTRWVEE